MQRRFRASSYKPVNRASSVTGANSVVCSYGKFQPGRDEFRKHNQILTRQKLCYLGRSVSKAKLFSLSKKFRSSHRTGVFIWENFHPGYRDVGHKNRAFGNRAISRTVSWGCAARCYPKPFAFIRPKSEIFPTLFMTWPKLLYPI